MGGSESKEIARNGKKGRREGREGKEKSEVKAMEEG